MLRRVFDQHVQVVCFAVAGEQPAAHFVEDVQRVIRQAVECSGIDNPSSLFCVKRPAKLAGAKLTVLGRSYYLWLSRPIAENRKPKSWEFSTDARGRW